MQTRNATRERTTELKKKLISLGFTSQEIKVKTIYHNSNVNFRNTEKASQMINALVAHGFQVEVFYESKEIGAPVSFISACWYQGIVPCVKEF